MKSKDIEIHSQFMIQPIDHKNLKAGYFKQRIYLVIPKESTVDAPVFFMLGGEGPLNKQRIMMFYKFLRKPKNIVMIVPEHRGYGKSISKDLDQSIPTYLTIPQTLQDFHQVAIFYQRRFGGPWFVGGYSYAGGLAINYGYEFPDDVKLVFSSSGVVDWPVRMPTYDKQVRINLGMPLYSTLVKHVDKLKPVRVFDQNWLDRELILAFVTGFSQYDEFNLLMPLFKFLAKKSTPTFLKALKWLDKVFAQHRAIQYALSNAKQTLSRLEALTEEYGWRYWRYQQFCETGVFWQADSLPSVYQRTQEDLIEECRTLFKMDLPILTKSLWSPREMVSKLKIPIIYVVGGKDPWAGVCLEQTFPISNGKYIYFPKDKHCSDGVKKANAQVVLAEILKFL